jgi:hypothetical protein
MFEAKGVTNAKERLQLLVGNVRQPFPAAAQEAQVGAALLLFRFLCKLMLGKLSCQPTHCSHVVTHLPVQFPGPSLGRLPCVH